MLTAAPAEASTTDTAAAPTPLPRVQLGTREVSVGGPELGRLRSSYFNAEPIDVLRARLADDGYLLLRSVVPTATVTAARQVVVDHLAAAGKIDTTRARLEAVLPSLASGATTDDRAGAYLGGVETVTHHADFLHLVQGPALVTAIEALLGEPSITPRYKWLRAVGPGPGTSPHYDVVFMGRGTRRKLFTCWTPLGDIGFDHGPLALLTGSHNLDSYRRIRETYGAADVDIDNIDSNFSHEPLEITERFGGQWQTAEFQAGDVLLFGMYTMHAAVANRSERLRISADVRFQPASEPVDPRWFGGNAVGNYGWKKIGPVVPLAVSRQQWGV